MSIIYKKVIQLYDFEKEINKGDVNYIITYILIGTFNFCLLCAIQ